MLFFWRASIQFLLLLFQQWNLETKDQKEKFSTSLKESGQTWLSQLLKKCFISGFLWGVSLLTNINLSLGRLALKFHSVWSIIIPFTKSYVEWLLTNSVFFKIQAKKWTRFFKCFFITTINPFTRWKTLLCLVIANL